jgi:hypothetical protein
MRAFTGAPGPGRAMGEGSDRMLSKNTSTRSMRSSTRPGPMDAVPPRSFSLEVGWRASQGQIPY